MSRPPLHVQPPGHPVARMATTVNVLVTTGKQKYSVLAFSGQNHLDTTNYFTCHQVVKYGANIHSSVTIG